MKFKKSVYFQMKTNVNVTRVNAKKTSKMIQNVRINSILTTFILLIIKDRNIGFLRIFSGSKTEKNGKIGNYHCTGNFFMQNNTF